VGDADTPIADMFDSMALVEYVLVVAEELGMAAAELEKAVGRKFSTIAELARALEQSSLGAGKQPRPGVEADAAAEILTPAANACWLSAVAVQLPQRVQTAGDIDDLLGKPPGWWQEHTGNVQRRLWGEEDALAAAAAAGRECLAGAGVAVGDVDVLLVTSEAPPLLVGLGAAVHARLDLPQRVPVFDVGNACTGFLAALGLARTLTQSHGRVLIVCLEAASRWLRVEPGTAGEAAALFGDAAAACLVGQPAGPARVLDMEFGVDGSAADLIVAEHQNHGIELRLDGRRLASAAVQAMAGCAQAVLARHSIRAADLEAVVMHAGNGRFPPLLARKLGVPVEHVWSQTACTGNLGSASLPVAWALQTEKPRGPTLWVAVGAGITVAAALTVGTI
jgi:3-oxoacyl-[acyl-carrier-protein] synthase-3